MLPVVQKLEFLKPTNEISSFQTSFKKTVMPKIITCAVTCLPNKV